MGRIFSIKGRATRSDFWRVVLMVQVPLQCVAFSLLLSVAYIHKTCTIKFYELSMNEKVFCAIAIVIAVVAVVCSIGVSVRRLHDLNYSGRWLFLIMVLNGIPYVRGLAFAACLVLLGCVKGSDFENRYGKSNVGIA